MKEVHHRVKNNLQVIASLLRLEAGRSAHRRDQVRARGHAGPHPIHGAPARVALPLRLVRGGGSGVATFSNSPLSSSARWPSRPGTVSLHLDLAPVQVVMDQAIPCGLLVNELVSNSLNFRVGYSFPPETGGWGNAANTPYRHRLTTSSSTSALGIDPHLLGLGVPSAPQRLCAGLRRCSCWMAIC